MECRVTSHAVRRYRERVPEYAARPHGEVAARIRWHVGRGRSDGGRNGRGRLVRHMGLTFACRAGGWVVTVWRDLAGPGWDGEPVRPVERGARRRAAMGEGR